jgi:hypothetical protein
MMIIDNIKAADIARLEEIFCSYTPEEIDELRDIIRRCIAGLAPDAADAAIVERFHELKILREVWREACMGTLINWDPNDPGNWDPPGDPETRHG